MRIRNQTPGIPPSIQRTDVDLLSRIMRRDPSAMGDLYDRYGKLAYTIILRIVGNKLVAEDLLAETFVKVWNRIDRWKEARMEDLRLWLLLLARDHAIEYLRSRNEPLPRALPRPAALTQPAVLQDFPRPRNNEHWEDLRNAVASLSEGESRVLEMACFDGLSPSEIAANSGETLLTVRAAIVGALQKLSIAGHAS
jgi:RNA polymerase sigma-70 factor (ECF subfamily)